MGVIRVGKGMQVRFEDAHRGVAAFTDDSLVNNSDCQHPPPAMRNGEYKT